MARRAETAAIAEEELTDRPSGLLERTLRVIELLAANAPGMILSDIADRLAMPRSAAHRVLAALILNGYVRQERSHGAYLLTAKVASLAFTFLSGSGVTDIAQPILDRLARETNELVRLAIVDGERLTWVAKSQGQQFGLRYDPEMGQEGRLSCSASGQAWLSTMPEAEAVRLVEAQGFGRRRDYGPRAPESRAALAKALRLVRKRGYSMTVQTFTPWMSAMAAPIRGASGEVSGTVSVAGPYQRLTEERMHGFAPALLAAAAELGIAGPASPSFAGATRSGSIFG